MYEKLFTICLKLSAIYKVVLGNTEKFFGIYDGY